MALTDSQALEVERIVKRLLGNLSAAVAGQQDGTTVSDGHRVLNFQGSGVTVSDDAAARRMNVFIPGGGLSASSWQLGSAVGAGKTFDAGVSGTPPTGWYTTGFSDAAWPASVAQTLGVPATALSGSAWVANTAGNVANLDIWLLRRTFTPPAGTITAASIQFLADDATLALYVNGNPITINTAPTGAAFQTVSISPSLLNAGASNLIAFEVQNVHSGSTPSSLDFLLTLSLATPVSSSTNVLLDFRQATDVTVSVSSSTWTNIGSSQSFTVTNAGAIIEAVVGGYLECTGGSATHVASAILIDGTTRIQIGGNYKSAGDVRNALSGTAMVSLGTLSAGSHTIQVQVYGNSAGFTATVRPVADANAEMMVIRVFQRG